MKSKGKNVWVQIAVLCLIAVSVHAQTVNHWETVVYDSSMWRNFPGVSDPGATWMQSNFNDASWAVSKGGFGYLDDDDRTAIAPGTISVYTRIKFTITDLTKIQSALLHVDYDDGYVAYLNGDEISRANIDGAPTFDQFSTGDHEALLYSGNIPNGVVIDKQKLKQGENVLSVEVHNLSAGSSDLTCRAFLSVGIKDATVAYGELPEWFIVPEDLISNLPIVVINTNGQNIQDDARIVADMGIIDNQNGINNVTDAFNGYTGKISIETRGESSQGFPKKSYSVETQNNLGENRDVSLLGMPVDNDWILYAPYTDKTMMRDVITYEWGKAIGLAASRSRYVEVIVNGDYKGVYVLLEKIKRGKDRVDIAKLKPTDISGDDLTGGYLLRIDKIDFNDYPAWVTDPTPNLPTEDDVRLQFHDPQGEALVPKQQEYIKGFMQTFESSLSKNDFTNATGYKKYIDISSFVDFLIMNELGKNVDAYIFSTYLYKDKDSKDPDLHMGPLWDFNLAYGNVDYWDNSESAPGWTYSDQYRIYWFRRMMLDPAFSGKVKCRWQELRTQTLSNANITNTIDSIATLLGQAQVRNYKRWPILGVYVWPNQFLGATYQEEVNWLKNWINNRVIWMDNNLDGGTCGETPVTGVEDALSGRLTAYPNPTSGSVEFELPTGVPGGVTLSVFNSIGEKVFTEPHLSKTSFTWQATDRQGNKLRPGMYIVIAQSPGKPRYTTKLIIL